MWHKEFDDSKVYDWIEDCAQRAADEALTCKNPLNELSDCVLNACDGYIIYCDDALALVAYYGVFDCAFGRNESYEDSPIAQFEQDVYERAEQIINDD